MNSGSAPSKRNPFLLVDNDFKKSLRGTIQLLQLISGGIDNH